MPAFTQEQFDDVDGHTYEVYLCEGNPEIIEDLADLVRELYLGDTPPGLTDTLEGAVEDLEVVVETSFVGQLIDKMKQSAIPEPGAAEKLPPQLDVARNELAEVVAYEVVEQLHGASIPARRVREKESSLPSRGLDLLSLIEADEGLLLLITEVKTSDDEASPPSVVDSGSSCLDAQTRAFLTDDGKKLLAELLWALKHARDDMKDIVARAVVLLGLEQLDLRVAPVLVRPRSALGKDDFGCFRDEPARYEPASVSFVVVVVEEELEDLSKAVYDRAREDAA